jgi:hypothetical protein
MSAVLAARSAVATVVLRLTRQRCPQHPETVMDGGPVLFHCPAGPRLGHPVHAADLSHEIATPVPTGEDA